MLSALENGNEEQLAEIVPALLSAAEDSPGFANIAADWLHYGRYGVAEDKERAAHFRAKAVDALIPDAVYDHALLVDAEEGGGPRRALPYYVLAATLGDADAISALSEYFLYGTEFETDYFIAGALTKHATLMRAKDRENE